MRKINDIVKDLDVDEKKCCKNLRRNYQNITNSGSWNLKSEIIELRNSRKKLTSIRKKSPRVFIIENVYWEITYGNKSDKLYS